MSAIARLKLSDGEIGYYDHVSGVYLTRSNPIVDIEAGTNCSVLRRSVKCGRLQLLTGSLGKGRSLKEILSSKKAVNTEIKPAIQPEVKPDQKPEVNPEPEVSPEPEAKITPTSTIEADTSNLKSDDKEKTVTHKRGRKPKKAEQTEPEDNNE